MLESLNEAISISSLCILCDGWARLYKLRFQQVRLRMVFTTLPASATKALSIARTRAPQVKMKEVDENKNVVMGPDSQPALTYSYRKRSLSFSVERYAEPRVGLKRSGSVKKAGYISERC